MSILFSKKFNLQFQISLILAQSHSISLNLATQITFLQNKILEIIKKLEKKRENSQKSKKNSRPIGSCFFSL